MVKPKRNNKKCAELFDDFLEKHLSLIQPIKTENEMRVYFKDIKCLVNDTDSLKDIFLLLHDTHCSDWIQRNAPNNFTYEPILDAGVFIKHASYKNYFRIWFDNGTVTRYKDELDKIGSSSRFDHTVFMYLASKGYLLPMYCWWKSNGKVISQDNFTPNRIVSYFYNVILIS